MNGKAAAEDKDMRKASVINEDRTAADGIATVTALLDEAKARICDELCKFPELYKNDEDRLMIEQCIPKCPLSML